MAKSYLSFMDLLQLMFIWLKLKGEIDWPWGWVLLPALLVIVFGDYSEGG